MFLTCLMKPNVLHETLHGGFMFLRYWKHPNNIFLILKILYPTGWGLSGYWMTHILPIHYCSLYQTDLKLQYGKPLLSEDMTDANAYIRNFLGKDIGSALDNYARTLIEGPEHSEYDSAIICLCG